MSPEECFDYFLETGCTTYYTYVNDKRVTAYIDSADNFICSIDGDKLEWFPDD